MSAATELLIPLRRIVRCTGIYDINGDGAKAEMPARALWLGPDAAESFELHLRDVVVVSDMFRSADSSLAARKAGRGAAAPGRSAHNYGRAIDVDVAATMATLGMASKAELDAWMARRGWYCWREDHTLGRESWHYFYAGGPATAPAAVSYRHGNAVGWWAEEMTKAFPVSLDVLRRQRALAKLGMYSGALDGRSGPLTRQALTAFGRAWGASDDRTLAFVEWNRVHAPALRSLS